MGPSTWLLSLTPSGCIGTLVGTLDIELVKTETLTWIISCEGRGGTSEVQQFEWSRQQEQMIGMRFKYKCSLDLKSNSKYDYVIDG